MTDGHTDAGEVAGRGTADEPPDRPELLLYRCPIDGDWEATEAGNDLAAALATVLALVPDTASVWAVHRDSSNERWPYSHPLPAFGSLMLFKVDRRAVHVVGGGQLADHARVILAAGRVPGWTLHPTRNSATPLVALEPLLTTRFFGLLRRGGFETVEEVEATPQSGLLQLRNSGPKFLTAVADALAQVGLDGAPIASPAPTDDITRRRQLLADRLRPDAAVRNGEFVDLLARSSIPPSALTLIAGSLNTELVPPADPTVIALLDTAGEAALLAHYARARQQGDQPAAARIEAQASPALVFTYRSPVNSGGAGEPYFAEDLVSALRGLLIECVALGRYSGSIAAAHHEKGQPRPFRYGGTGLGSAMLFSTGERSVHVVGDSEVAIGVRRALAGGEVPGWSLHPVRTSHTPLHELRGVLPTRSYRVLSRYGYSTVEEVEATPDAGLRRLNGVGDKFIGGLRTAIAGLALEESTPG